MNKTISGLYLSAILIAICLVSCSDPSIDLENKIAQAKADSTTQANIENDIIEKYILDNNLTVDSVDKYNIHYITVEVGDGITYPEVNDIVFLNYTGKFTDDLVFDTSIKSLALTLDSLAWVKKGVDVAKYMNENKVDLSAALVVFGGYDEPLDLPYYSLARTYQQIYYNYTPDGAYVPTGYVTGFYRGLKTLVPKLSLGGKGLVIMPSKMAYGTAGSSTVIPSNSVLMFEIDLVDIRKQ